VELVTDPATQPNILVVPVFNFPGWMLIMLYGTIGLLVGRWWNKKSGYYGAVGILYPFLTMFGALLMTSSISRLMLWLEPFFDQSQPFEWVMLAVHLLVRTALLIFLWLGKMNERFNLNDLPIFLLPNCCMPQMWFSLALVASKSYRSYCWQARSKPVSCFTHGRKTGRSTHCPGDLNRFSAVQFRFQLKLD
jgi:hypothetical protein